MAQWFSRRWAWAAVVGATVTAGFAAGRGDEAPQKVGATITLNIDGKGDRQFKVLKSEKQPDGSYLSELKDVKSGETITLLDNPSAAPAKGTEPPKGAEPLKSEAPKKAEQPKSPDAGPPKAKPRTSDPLIPPPTAAIPNPEKDKDKDKRPIIGRVFGDKDRDKTPPPPAPIAGTTVAKPEMPADPNKKPGLLSRVFGPKKPSTPSLPPATNGPVAKPSASSAPPAVVPTPTGGLAGSPSTPAGAPGSTAEPPRVMLAKPVTPPDAKPAPIPAPPVSSVQVPTPMPPAVPAPVPVPAPLPMPGLPLPVPSGGGLPPIPVPPSGTSSVPPIQIVVPVGYVPAGVAFDRDVEPFVIALQSMTAPSARLTAAKGLADGRHGSTDGVKGVLFEAAQKDPCSEVRAACITHLRDLGYFTPAFLSHIQTACGDADPMVSAAARAACAKMIRK
ncbi:MAG: hypothetical protein ACKODX_03295 [Gemmata sp.]